MQPLQWFELAALICCAINIHRFSENKLLKWFLPLLILTNLVEWGSSFKLFTLHLANGMRTTNWVYNIFNPIEFGFFTFYYRSLLTSVKERKILLSSYLVLLVLVIINVIFIQGWIYLDSYTYIIGCCLLVFFSFLYFRQIAKNVDETNPFTIPHFWVSIGVLLFYAGESVLFVFFEYFLKTGGFADFLPVFRFFSNFLNIIFYSTLSIAFFCPQKPRNILS